MGGRRLVASKANSWSRRSFTAGLQVRDGELADLQSIFGTSYPIQGRLNTALQIDGPRRQLNGAGHLALANAVAYGYPVRLAIANLEVRGQ